MNDTRFDWNEEFRVHKLKPIKMNHTRFSTEKPWLCYVCVIRPLNSRSGIAGLVKRRTQNHQDLGVNPVIGSCCG